MANLEVLIDQLSAMHHHLCPKQVLGARMGLYAAELLQLDLPQTDKRLFTFVETDGCYTDGVSVATGCWVGHRTLRMLDYGKVAATFADTLTNDAIRIRPHPQSRTRARAYAPHAIDKWHAQLTAYQVMPNEALFEAQPVELTVSLAALISKHGLRVACVQCGEDIINEREVRRDNLVLCRACAGDTYYQPATHLEAVLCKG